MMPLSYSSRKSLERAREAYEHAGDLKHNLSRGKPELIIFGETHTITEHCREQARSIIRNKPETVLHESLDNREPEELRASVQSFVVTLGEILGKLGMPLSSLERGKSLTDIIREATLAEERALFKDQKISKSFVEKTIKEQMGLIPVSTGELLDVPLYELPQTARYLVFEMLRDALDDKYEAELEKVSEKGLQTTENKFMRLNRILSFCESITRNEEGMGPILCAVRKVRARIAGCDIDKNAIPRMQFDGNSQSQFIKWSEELDEYLNKINPIREETMGGTMARFVWERTQNSPVIAVIGAVHARQDSPIHDILAQNKIPYRCIIQGRPLIADGSANARQIIRHLASISLG